MSGLLHLTDLCDVERLSRPSEAYGSKPDYGFHLQGIPCRLVEKKSTAASTLTGETVTTTITSISLGGNVDVKGGDKITNIFLDGVTKLENAQKVAIEYLVEEGDIIPRRGRSQVVKVFTLKAIK